MHCHHKLWREEKKSGEESKMFVTRSKKHFFGLLCHFDIYELWVTQTAQIVEHP